MTIFHYEAILIAASAVVAFACSSSDSANPASGGPVETTPDPPPLEWSPCSGPGLEDLDCATLRVPMDYEHPDGDMIDIALSRAPATDPARRIGVLLLNPGGPGPGRGFNVELRRDMDADFPEVHARFDMVDFDPRGYGASTTYECSDVPSFGTVDWTPDGRRGATGPRTDGERIAAGCEEHGSAHRVPGRVQRRPGMDQIPEASAKRENQLHRVVAWNRALGTAYADLFPNRLRPVYSAARSDRTLDAESSIRERGGWGTGGVRRVRGRPRGASRLRRQVRRGPPGRVFDPSSRTACNHPGRPVYGRSTERKCVRRYVAQLVNVPASGPQLEEFLANVNAGNGDNVGLQVVHGIQGFARLIGPVHCADTPFTDPAAVYSKFFAGAQCGQPALRPRRPAHGLALRPLYGRAPAAPEPPCQRRTADPGHRQPRRQQHSLLVVRAARRRARILRAAHP